MNLHTHNIHHEKKTVLTFVSNNAPYELASGCHLILAGNQEAVSGVLCCILLCINIELANLHYRECQQLLRDKTEARTLILYECVWGGSHTERQRYANTFDGTEVCENTGT